MSMDTDLVLTQIRGVLPTALGHTVFLDAGQVVYVVHVDKTNGQLLVEALNGVEHPRPFTHDLIIECLQGLEASVQRIIVHSVDEGVFKARLILSMDNELGHKVVEVDARVSDCLVLAAYSGCAILTRKAVLNEVEDVSGIIEDLLRSQGQEEGGGEFPPFGE